MFFGSGATSTTRINEASRRVCEKLATFFFAFGSKFHHSCWVFWWTLALFDKVYGDGLFAGRGGREWLDRFVIRRWRRRKWKSEAIRRLGEVYWTSRWAVRATASARPPPTLAPSDAGTTGFLLFATAAPSGLTFQSLWSRSPPRPGLLESLPLIQQTKRGSSLV